MAEYHTPTPQDVIRLKVKLDAVLVRHREQGWPEGWPLRLGQQLNVEQTNRLVNNRIKYQADWRTFWLGRHNIPKPFTFMDYWETPAEALKRGVADCEEFALCKALMLAELGHKAWFAIGYDWTWRDWHAVCLVGDAVKWEDKGAAGDWTDKRLVLDIPGIPKWGKPWTVARYEMAGVMKFFPEMMWAIDAQA